MTAQRHPPMSTDNRPERPPTENAVSGGAHVAQAVERTVIAWTKPRSYVNPVEVHHVLSVHN
jgi:hypothetical protein